MARLHLHHDVDAAGLAALRRPRDDVVREKPAADGGAPGGELADGAADVERFAPAAGPFSRYTRTLQARPSGDDGRWTVDERIVFRLAVPFWSPLLVLPVKRALRRPRYDGRQPWWAPPGRLDAEEARTLSLLAILALVYAYLGTLLSQTLTYAAESFDAGTRAQGALLAAVRVGVLATLVAAAAADRVGRRRLVRGCLTAACLVMSTAALAPGLWWFGGAQTLSRGLTTATEVIVLILAAEELPARSRAWGVSVLTLAAGLGSGMVVWHLPLVGLGPQAWRLLYLPPLAFCVVVAWAARRLPESRRFRAAAAATGTAHLPKVTWREIDRHIRRRLALLGGSAVLLLCFSSPVSQFGNHFLRTERAMSPELITVFTLVTSTPAAVGVYLGGRLCETWGRRRVGALGIAGGTIFAVFSYQTFGWALWATSLGTTVLAGMTLPAMRVYQPELFPTQLRGLANGLIVLTGVIGTVVGVLAVGALSELWGSLSWPITLLSVAPLAVALLVLTVYPETANRELEELNPDDAGAAGIPQAAAAASGLATGAAAGPPTPAPVGERPSAE
ncbi:MAG: MFS transporter [Acidimicrobiia bacterium]|nr:MFS transporter [Acidimicrobiia bacterium]